MERDGLAQTSAPSAARHRPHLDGLRAVAVYLVVAFHAGIDRLPGGFIGVDVFFVLSGYLVTGLLVRDLDDHGRIAFGRFYARRVRRLLPAAALTLVATVVVFGRIGSPAEFAEAADAIRASALYFANWFFIARSTDYFAADINASPVLHFWSLAVEEQYYLIWPLILTGLHMATRRLHRPRRWLQLSVTVGAAASLIGAVSIVGHDLNRAYYGTDTRAYQLLAGALLALSPGVVARLKAFRVPPVLLHVGAAVMVAGLVVAASSLVDVDPVRRGIVATVVTVALLALLETEVGGPVQRLLSLPPVAYLGQISYGTYLWHWLVVVVATRELDLGSRSLVVVASVLATALASLSYQLLEQPVRTWSIVERHRAPTIAVGLVLSLVVGLVVAPQITNRGARAAAIETSTAATGELRSSDLDWQAASKDRHPNVDCRHDTLDACVLVEGSGPTVMLMGDSNALQLVPLLEEVAADLDLTFVSAVQPMCAWFRSAGNPANAVSCRQAKDDWYGPVMEAFDPDIVMLNHVSLDDPRTPGAIGRYGEGWLFPDDAGYDALLREQTLASIDPLLDAGRKVVIIEPVPQPTRAENPIPCISKSDDLNACRFVVGPGPTHEERYDRQLDQANPDLWALDLDHAVCPYLPICDPVVNGEIVMSDSTHLTSSFSRTLAPVLETYLLDNGIVESP